MKKLFGLIIFLAIVTGVIWYFGRDTADPNRQIAWGVTFSKLFSQKMGLDWKQNYLAILDDLKIKQLRLIAYWTEIEPAQNLYNFSDLDWQVEQAANRGVKIVLAVGQKLPRWPECHIPEWATLAPPGQSDFKDQELLKYIEAAVVHYKNNSAIIAWQIENEPFLPYGECPPFDSELLDKEIDLVRSLDSAHKILITESGELSSWLSAAKRSDIFGTTMYKIVWDKNFGYISYFFIPKHFYWFKANLVRLFYGNKPVIVSELQAEPWGPGLIYDVAVEEQLKSMNLKQFQMNLEFAKRVGFPEVYLWGSEWWYWMKEKHNDPSFWNEVQELFQK